MEPSKITITNVRDDEPNMAFDAEYVTPNDMITGLLINAAAISHQCGMSLEDILRAVVQCYGGSTVSEYHEEVFSDD